MFARLVKELFLYAVFTGMPVILGLAWGIFDHVFKIDIRFFCRRHVRAKECINL